MRPAPKWLIQINQGFGSGTATGIRALCTAAITRGGTHLLDNESSYFRARAEDEILAAECADHPDAARAHFLLAGYYLDMAFNPATGHAEI